MKSSLNCGVGINPPKNKEIASSLRLLAMTLSVIIFRIGIIIEPTQNLKRGRAKIPFPFNLGELIQFKCAAVVSYLIISIFFAAL